MKLSEVLGKLVEKKQGRWREGWKEGRKEGVHTSRKQKICTIEETNINLREMGK